jgi:hypothetical protein
MSISELSRQILMHGLTDWVQMSEVASVAKGLLRDSSQDELRDQCVRAIGELRDGNLVRVGDLAREGFTAWTGETKCILVRIDAEWRALVRQRAPPAHLPTVTAGVIGYRRTARLERFVSAPVPG